MPWHGRSRHGNLTSTWLPPMPMPPRELRHDTIQMMVKKQKGIDITLDEAQKMYDVKTDIFHNDAYRRDFPPVKRKSEASRKPVQVAGVVTGSGRAHHPETSTTSVEYLDEDIS